MNKYSVEIVWSDEDEAFLARCPEIGKSFIAFGDTRQEAIEEFEVALKVTLESLTASDYPIPEPRTIEHA